MLGLSVRLKKLERRFPILVKGGNLAVDGRDFGGQQLQGIDQLRVIAPADGRKVAPCAAGARRVPDRVGRR